MNELLVLLSGGNLLSDGRANEAADRVLAQPQLIDQLVEGLSASEDVIRARTAHALERISRSQPELVHQLLPQFKKMALSDPVPMVKWHMAMIFGNLPLVLEELVQVIPILFQMLDDPSVFVKSWAIVSLTILGRRHPVKRTQIAEQIRRLQNDQSTAVRHKVLKALKVLESEAEPIPAGWVKSVVLGPA
jgi:HEAT repeat protein